MFLKNTGAGNRTPPGRTGMTGFLEMPACIADPWQLAALAGLGLSVGVATGLFGVGGAFLITPLLNILFHVPYTLATGSSMLFTIGTSVAAWIKHMRLGNVALKTMTILCGGAVCGTMLGARLHVFLKARAGEFNFTLVMHGIFIAVLAVTAFLVWRNRSEARPSAPLLARVPGRPRITIRATGINNISLPGLCALGLLIGVVKGLLGIGGGVLFMPAMLLVIGLTIHQAIGTSLGVVLFSSIAGAIIYGRTGQVSLWIVLPLLTGSLAGVQAGVWLSRKLNAGSVKKYFSILIVLVILAIIYDFISKFMPAAR